MEGYKPQDFSFFHRSEKLVQHLRLYFRRDSGMSHVPKKIKKLKIKKLKIIRLGQGTGLKIKG